MNIKSGIESEIYNKDGVCISVEIEREEINSSIDFPVRKSERGRLKSFFKFLRRFFSLICLPVIGILYIFDLRQLLFTEIPLKKTTIFFALLWAIFGCVRLVILELSELD